MRIKIFLLMIASVWLFLSSGAQFYYKDIVTTAQTNTLWKDLSENNVRLINIETRDYDGQPIEDLAVQQEIVQTKNQLITRSRSSFSSVSILTSFYNANGKIIQSRDSSAETIAVTDYTYDGDGRLSVIDLQTHTSDGDYSQSEKHEWHYNEKGMPDKMIKVKNGLDTSVITIVADDNAMPAEESELFSSGKRSEKFYYYYDDQKRLTDIVRFSSQANRLLPDYIFEHNPDNSLSSMTIIQGGGSNYLIWLYAYDNRGLKTKETCFNKQKELQGTVIYNYQ